MSRTAFDSRFLRPGSSTAPEGSPTPRTPDPLQTQYVFATHRRGAAGRPPRVRRLHGTPLIPRFPAAAATANARAAAQPRHATGSAAQLLKLLRCSAAPDQCPPRDSDRRLDLETVACVDTSLPHSHPCAPINRWSHRRGARPAHSAAACASPSTSSCARGGQDVSVAATLGGGHPGTITVLDLSHGTLTALPGLDHPQWTSLTTLVLRPGLPPSCPRPCPCPPSRAPRPSTGGRTGTGIRTGTRTRICTAVYLSLSAARPSGRPIASPLPEVAHGYPPP